MGTEVLSDNEPAIGDTYERVGDDGGAARTGRHVPIRYGIGAARSRAVEAGRCAVSGSIADVLAGRATWAMGNCDGFALAAMLGDGAVDHVIGDPPYDEHTHASMRTNRKGAGDESDIDFAALPPMNSFLPAILSCSRRWSILFCSMTMFGDYLRAAGGWRTDGGFFVRDGIWHRTNSTPAKTGDRPAQGCEGLSIMHTKGGKMRWNGGGKQGVWRGPICADPRRIHPTKKPLWLMEALVRDFTEPGDLVFDPTAGEGTTGEACVRLGRRFIGCELRGPCPDCGGGYPRRCEHGWANYYQAGVERIGRAASGLKQVEMFA